MRPLTGTLASRSTRARGSRTVASFAAALRAALEPQDLDPAVHVEQVDEVAAPGGVPRVRARVRRRVGALDVVVADLPEIARVRRVDDAQALVVPRGSERRSRQLEVVRRA